MAKFTKNPYKIIGVSVAALTPAFLYLAWYLMAGIVYGFFGIETRGRSFEAIEEQLETGRAWLPRPAADRVRQEARDMKTLVLAVMILSVMQAFGPVPMNAADNPGRTSQSVKSDASSDQKPVDSTAIKSPPTSDSGENHGQPETSQNEKRAMPIRVIAPVDVKKSGWDYAYIVLTGALVLVGVCTLIAIWYQAVQTRKAAVASEKSIGLQERAMEQWVDVTNWRTDDITRADKPENADGTPTKRVRIRADILNKTKFPLTLAKAEITIISNFDGMVVPYIYSLPRNYFLTPQLPYVVDIRIEVSDGQYRALLDGLLPFRIEGSFSHVGVLGKLLNQPIQGMLVCGISGARFESELPMHPRDPLSKEQRQG